MRRRTPAQGNALGVGIDRCALQGRRNPPPLQGGTWTRPRPRGVAPGWHPPRRWRVIVAAFSTGENCYKAIYEIAFDYRGAQLSGDGRGGQGLWVQRFLGFFDAAVDGGLPIGMRDDRGVSSLITPQRV